MNFAIILLAISTESVNTGVREIENIATFFFRTSIVHIKPPNLSKVRLTDDYENGRNAY